MSCPECERLKTEYERLLREYHASTAALTSYTGTAVGEYNRLRIRADDARIEAEVARLLLACHKKSHPSHFLSHSAGHDG